MAGADNSVRPVQVRGSRHKREPSCLRTRPGIRATGRRLADHDGVRPARRAGASPTQVHPDFFEAPEVLAERQQLYRNGCYLLEIGEKPTGYVLSHPWRAGSLPALNTHARRTPRRGRHLLHPRPCAAAGHPPPRRRQPHRRGPRQTCRASQGFPPCTSLPSTARSGSGKSMASRSPRSRSCTASAQGYEDPARYMVRRLV